MGGLVYSEPTKPRPSQPPVREGGVALTFALHAGSLSAGWGWRVERRRQGGVVPMRSGARGTGMEGGAEREGLLAWMVRCHQARCSGGLCGQVVVCGRVGVGVAGIC